MIRKITAWFKKLYKQWARAQFLKDRPDPHTLVIVGHKQYAPGAQLYDGQHEWDFNRHVAAKLERPDLGIITSLNPDHEKYAYKRCVELHVNASGDPRARGCEYVSLGDAASIQWGAQFMAALFNEYGIPHRRSGGLKLVKEGERGFRNLERMPVVQGGARVLLEPCFGDFRTEESEQIIKDPWRYAEVILGVLCGFKG